MGIIYVLYKNQTKMSMMACMVWISIPSLMDISETFQLRSKSSLTAEISVVLIVYLYKRVV
jgi:low affinity Fe/Cu permease